MKVGDLVTLSKYGRDRNYNARLTRADQLGVIVNVHSYLSYPYKVKWMKEPTPKGFIPSHSRRELKYAYR